MIDMVKKRLVYVDLFIVVDVMYVVTEDQKLEAKRLYGLKILRHLKQSLALLQIKPVLNRFRNLFNNKFGFGNENEESEQDLSSGFGQGEGVTVEEVVVAGFTTSESSTSSLPNNFGSKFNHADPYSKTPRMKHGRNLVI